jgi:TolA-binding protein
VYPDPEVIAFISGNFIPLRFDVRKNAQPMERFGANWTPTILVLDSDGKERHRIEGYLPKDDFLGQLKLGLAHAAFVGKRFDEAERRFREIVQQHPNSDAAPEAQYWAGVSKYKGSGDGAALGETAKAFQQRYPESPWAKKASVWAA